MNEHILVTGGAGYIGSHVVKMLGDRGHDVVVVDNLSTGFRDAVLHGELVIGDTGDTERLMGLLRDYRVNAVMHFAAHIVVPESVDDPLKYYRNNTCNTRTLLECCARVGVANFIFSSTAAVYGIPETTHIAEDTPTVPINPYGSSKLMSEWMLRDLSAASSLKHVILRYFNVAGADPDGQLGQSTPAATHLIKVACETAVGKRDRIQIFGADYPTPDGTCIRDYIHVSDLAAAHLLALEYLIKGGASDTFNCGYGHGYSVREVLDAVDRVSAYEVERVESPRRAGDPPALTADSAKIRSRLEWRPRYDDLDFIVSTALEWERWLQSRGTRPTDAPSA